MTSRPRLAVVGVAAAILVSVVACSSTTSSADTAASSAASQAADSSAPPISIPTAVASAPTGGGSALDAATLVTADLAASIVGGSPTAVTPPMNIPNISIASYSNANGDTVTVFVETIPGGIANTQLQAAIAMAGAQGELQPITGIGDVAGKIVDANDATVAFVKGSNLVVLQAESGTTAGSDLEPKVESVAQQVASRL